MIIHKEPHSPSRRIAMPSRTKFRPPADCPVESCSAISLYESELKKHKATEAALRMSLQRESTLLAQKDALLQRNEVLNKESEHRLLNGLQLIASLLSMQSRVTKAEAAAELTIAANRVAAIGRIHRHLHTLDHVESVEFKQYLENLCRDLSDMTPNDSPGNVLTVEGVELQIPTATGMPLAFIASELITNAIKYAKGRITVGLQQASDSCYTLSVCDEGPGLPDGFDPTARHGLGMKLISSLVRQIGGKLQMSRGDNGHGTRFTVLFAQR